jgi:hypothetical protein
MFEPRNVVLNLDEFSEMEIRPNLGASCRRRMLLHFFKRFSRMLSYVLVACHPASDSPCSGGPATACSTRTKIWKGLTNVTDRIFEALLNDS